MADYEPTTGLEGALAREPSVGKKSKGKSADPIIEKLSADSLIIDFDFAKQCFLLGQADFLGKGEESLYKNNNGFRHSIAVEDRDVGTLVSRINKPPAKNISKFLNITSLEYSRFVPKIQLYKVLYKGARDFVGEAPIPFSTDSGRSIESILASGGARGDDAGIVDFSINFENADPFTAKMVNGSLKILFQNGESLTKDRVLNKSTVGGGTTPFKFSDLISRRGQSAREFAGEHYRIRADIGYQAPANMSDDLNEALVEQLQSMNLSLILELIDYELDFQENGALMLEISYRSYIEAVLDRSTYDIFTITGAKGSKVLDENIAYNKKKIERAEKIEKALKLEALKLGKLNEDGWGIWGRLGSSLNEASQEELDKAIKDQEQAREAIKGNESAKNIEAGRNKVTKYSRIVSHMFDNNKIRKLTIKKENLLYYSKEYSNAFKESIRNLSNFSAGTSVLDAQKLLVTVAKARNNVAEQVRQEVRGQGGGQVVNGTGNNISKEYDKRVRALAKKEDGGATTQDMANTAAGNTVGDIASQIKKPDTNSGSMNIYWFYLGDLLTAVVDTAELSEKLRQDHIGFMYANAMLPNEQKAANITLLDVPISLEMFMQFFKKMYIDRDVTRYSLRKFIQDAIQQLLLPSMNQRCQGESVGSPMVVKTTTIEVGSYGDTLSEPFPSYSEENPKRIYSNSSQGSNLMNLSSSSVLNKRNADQRYFYTMVYMVPKGLPSDLSGDPIKDSEKGIYHFYIGADRGIVKSTKFSKAKKNFQAEAMAQKAVSSGDEFAEIFNLFNVDVEMIGNTLLKPGCYIYINPTLTGLGIDTSKTLGLGGYYFVLGVSNQLSKDGWTTSIKADAVSRISNPALSVFNPAVSSPGASLIEEQ